MSRSQQLTIQQAISRAKKATKQGNTAVAVNLYNAILQQQPNHPFAKKALRKLQTGLPQNPSMEEKISSPPQDQIASLKNLYQSGQMAKAEQASRELLNTYPQTLVAINVLGAALHGQGKLQEAVQAYDKAIQLNPDYAEAYSNRGVALQELGLLDEAVESCEKAVRLNPDYAEAYYNRGNALKELRQLDEAVASYDRTIRLKPDYVEAYSNRGAALQDLVRLDEAVASYDRAIRLKPDYVEAYYNRGNALKELGQLEAAIANYQKAVSIDPKNSLLWEGSSDVLQIVRFSSCSDDDVHFLLQVLEQSTTSPNVLSGAIASALLRHPIISPALELSKSDRIDKNNIDHITEQLSTVPLLLRMMELSPIADLDVEKMLKKMRRAMLHKAASGGEAKGLPFYSALAMHCFTNEYVFSESKKEKQQTEVLQEEVKATLAKGDTISPTWIAVLGTYRPLHSFSWANDLLKTGWPEEIKKVIVGQVANVRQEQILRSKIPRLSSIDDKVSQLVRNQYEENPYPRWVNTGLSDKPNTTRQVLQLVNPHLNFDVQQFSNNPDILVAGCGTGQHALSTASSFLNCNVLAVDLSLSSLSYAIRKTKELGVTNIEYMQGDILKLDQLEREFDIVECAGVLHHMDNPLAGWEVLVDKLRVGGVMKIGLYSEIARRHVVACRREIAENGYTSSPDDIRRYREEVIKLGPDSDSEIIQVLNSSDFYSLSTCRDLLFHVQEHRFTLLQIEEALNDLGLKFLGFGLQKSWIRNEFRKLHPEQDALVSLPLWHQFELKNPGTFSGMYQFWAQKT